MTAISARSRKPIKLGGRLSSWPSFGSGPILSEMMSSSSRAWSALSTGVLPFFTTCLAARTAAAGLVSMIWPVISQSKSIPKLARRCLTFGVAWLGRQLG